MNFTSPQSKIARFTPSQEFIKDHHFYSGNDITWNKACLSGPKMYEFYHKQIDANKERVEAMNQQEIEEKRFVEHLHRQRVLRARDEGQQRYAAKVREREVIEGKCNEAKARIHNFSKTSGIETPDILDIVSKKTNSFKQARSRDTSWNFLDKASEKNIKQVLVPTVLKGEEEMVKHIQKQVNKEFDMKQQQERNKADFRNKLREDLYDRHEKTFELEQKVGTMSVKSHKNTVGTEDSFSPSYLLPSLNIDKDRGSPTLSLNNSARSSVIRVRFQNAQNILEGRSSHQSIIPSRLRQFSVPNTEAPGLKKVLDLVQGDLKGTLIKNLERGNYSSNNAVQKTLVRESQVFQDILEENIANTSASRDSFSIQYGDADFKPKKRYLLNNGDQEKMHQKKPNKKIREITERELVLNDINSFEKSLMNVSKAEGHGKVFLEEALKMCSQLGVTPKNYANRRVNSEA